MLVIWGRTNSVNVQKVLWCCDELGIEYERIDAGGPFGVVDTPEYRRRNPNGLVPTIDDDGFVLWESNAIVRYLAAKHRCRTSGPRIHGCGPRPTSGWTGPTRFWAALRTASWASIRTPPEKRNEAAIAESLRKTDELLHLVDEHLRSRAYLAGEASPSATSALGARIWRWMAMPIERPAQPSRERWFEGWAQRPAYRKIVMSPLS